MQKMRKEKSGKDMSVTVRKKIYYPNNTMTHPTECQCKNKIVVKRAQDEKRDGLRHEVFFMRTEHCPACNRDYLITHTVVEDTSPFTFWGMVHHMKNMLK